MTLYLASFHTSNLDLLLFRLGSYGNLRVSPGPLLTVIPSKFVVGKAVRCTRDMEDRIREEKKRRKIYDI